MKPLHTGVIAGVAALILSLAPKGVAEPQSPLRIGASISKTGAYAAIGQNVLRGYQLCVKHTNEKGGILGRRIDFAVEDDQSQPAAAVRIYEKLITEDKVDGVFSPYSSPLTDAVAEVVEKHKVPMVACCAAVPAIYRKGRKFIFMVPTTSDRYLEGVVEIAATRGLKTIALIYEETLHPKAITEGVIERARKKGLQIARQYPGAREFVEAHQEEFPGADLSYQTAEGYAACQIFVAAVKRAASLDADKVRDAILKMDINTVFGPFRVDRDGVQLAHRMVTYQWQDGKKVIVWPDELASGKPRFPTPPWSQRP